MGSGTQGNNVTRISGKKRVRKKKFLTSLKQLTPGQALILYYAVAILTGSVLLSLPVASAGKPLHYIDALFTAASAQCVTGLTVVDTGSALSLFGQIVILVLIQIGGLGITTFSVYLFFFLHQGVGARGRWIISETLLHTPVSSMGALVGGIIIFVFSMEALGAVLLGIVFIPDLGLGKGLFASVFHSVSAFCNAGFSLFPDSLTRYRSSFLFNITVMWLIVSGGVGFLVIREINDIFLRRYSSRRPRLSLHSKLVLWTTGILVLGGGLLILSLERSNALNGMSGGVAVMAAFFQSVTARTAGFNTVDIEALQVSTLLFLIFLMFVGASPGSAGGGIKTTSLALFVAILHSRMRGNSHTNIFRRTIPEELVTKVLALVMLAIFLITSALFVLLLVQHPGTSSQPGAVFLQYLFETVSAFGTVGLTMGATANLTTAGKLIIIALMFIGRVGLLTVAFTFVKRLAPDAPRYAEENIMIG